MKTKCPGCGLELEQSEGATDPYGGSSPACWALFGRLLAKEAEDPAFFAVNRLTVDSYMAQHPSDSSRAAVQSVWVHLVGLHLVLEREIPMHLATKAIGWLTKPIRDFGKIAPAPHDTGIAVVTVQDLLDAATAAAYSELARNWGLAVLNSYSAFHDEIGALADKAMS